MDLEEGPAPRAPCAVYSARWSEQLTQQPECLAACGWDAFSVYATGASGPRAFATMGFDLQLLQLLRNRALTGHKWLLGGSTGTLRGCALLSSSLMPPGTCLTEVLKEHFVHMVYRRGDTPETLAPLMASLYEKVLPPCIADAVLSHPTMHLAVMVTQILPHHASLPPWQLRAMFWYYLGANFLTADALRGFQRRLCFYSGHEPPPFITPDDNVTCIPLTRSNVYQVLQATTCLPFISPHCEHIDGVGRGLFVDGAFGNYHLNLPSTPDYPVLLLGDGPTADYKQTIWDSYVPYRYGPFHQNVSVLYPNPAFERAMLARAMPNTFDYFKDAYIRNPELRHTHWRHCYDTSLRQFPSHPLQLSSALDLQAALPVPPRAASGVFSAWSQVGSVKLGRSYSTGQLRSRAPTTSLVSSISEGASLSYILADGGASVRGQDAAEHSTTSDPDAPSSTAQALSGGMLRSVSSARLLAQLDAHVRWQAAHLQLRIREVTSSIVRRCLGGASSTAAAAATELLQRGVACVAALGSWATSCAGPQQHAGRRSGSSYGASSTTGNGWSSHCHNCAPAVTFGISSGGGVCSGATGCNGTGFGSCEDLGTDSDSLEASEDGMQVVLTVAEPVDLGMITPSFSYHQALPLR